MQNPVYANGKTDVELVNGNYVVTARFTTDKTKGEVVSRTVYSRHAALILISALTDAPFVEEETASITAFPEPVAAPAEKRPRSRSKANPKGQPQHKD